MAVNKNFVVKNGLEVNTNLLVADLDTQTVGIGTTISPHELHVVGGIGATNLNITGVATIANLRLSGVTTFVGFTTFQGDISVGGASTFKGLVDINGGGQANTFKVEDLTDNRVVIAGTGGELEDDGNFTFTGNQLTLGVGATVGGGLTASSVMVEDLTNNRVVIAGTDGELEDSSNFVFDGSQLILGVGATVGGGLTVAGVTVFDNDVEFKGVNGITSVSFDQSSNSLDFIDGAKAQFGTGDDLQIYHDGTSSYVDNSTGGVYIRNLSNDQDIFLQSDDGSGGVANYILCNGSNGQVELFHYGNAKLNTTTKGIHVAGEIETDSVGIADSIFHVGDDNTQIRFPTADTFTIETGGTEAFRVASDQKVYFGDFASAGSKAYIEKEVSGEYKLNIHASSSTSQNRAVTLNSREDVEALRITADGDVGIGTTNPTGNNAVDAANEAVLAVGVVTAREYYGDGSNLSGLPQSGIGIRSDGTAVGFGVTFLDFIGSGVGTATVDTASGIATVNISGGGGSSVTINNNADNRIITGSGTADTLNGEANLTFDGTQFAVVSGGATVGGGLTVAGIGILKDDVQFHGVNGVTTVFFDKSANALNFLDGAKAQFGDGQDLRIQHNSIHSYISNYTGQLNIESEVTDGYIAIRNDNGSGSQTDYIVANGSSGEVELYHYGSEKFSTKAYGIDVTGRVEADDVNVSGGSTFAAATFNGDTTFVGDSANIVFDKSQDRLEFADTAAAVFGTNDDLQIYHNSHSYIDHTGANNLHIRNTVDDQDVTIQTDDGSGGTATYFQAEGASGEASLHHLGNKKIATKAYGVDVTGRVEADDVNVSGGSTFTAATFNGNVGIAESIFHVGDTNTSFGFPAADTFTIDTGGVERVRITSTGAIAIEGASNYGTSGQVLTSNGNDAPTWQDGGGISEVDTTVSTTNPTGVGSFATASFRSASVIAQINQLNTDYQVGRYLMIHDGTTVTVVEESAVSTGSTMLGSFTGVIDGSNVELRVTLATAGVSTVTTKIDTVTV